MCRFSVIHVVSSDELSQRLPDILMLCCFRGVATATTTKDTKLIIEKSNGTYSDCTELYAYQNQFFQFLCITNETTEARKVDKDVHVRIC